jgi:hypothetical protein
VGSAYGIRNPNLGCSAYDIRNSSIAGSAYGIRNSNLGRSAYDIRNSSVVCSAYDIRNSNQGVIRTRVPIIYHGKDIICTRVPIMTSILILIIVNLVHSLFTLATIDKTIFVTQLFKCRIKLCCKVIVIFTKNVFAEFFIWR